MRENIRRVWSAHATLTNPTRNVSAMYNFFFSLQARHVLWIFFVGRSLACFLLALSFFFVLVHRFHHKNLARALFGEYLKWIVRLNVPSIADVRDCSYRLLLLASFNSHCFFLNAAHFCYTLSYLQEYYTRIQRNVFRQYAIISQCLNFI